jgi:sorbitol-specific phosphotransferase system component IIBC
MLRGRRKALLALRQQFSSCSATTTTTTKKATTKAKSKNSKEQPCSALAIIADAGHGLGDFILVVFSPKENVIDKKKSALTPSLSLSFGYLLLTHSISLSF